MIEWSRLSYQDKWRRLCKEAVLRAVLEVKKNG